jgi:tetratricopeptide (TPR) repeat protein
MLREQLTNPDLSLVERGNAMHSLGDLLRMRGRVGEAERWYRDWMAVEYGSGRDFDAVYHLATLQAERGAPVEAMRTLAAYSADSLAPVERPYLLLAEFHAAAGRIDQARALVAKHEEHVPAGVRKHHNRGLAVQRVSGEIALREGRFEDAVADFTMVNQLSGSCATCGLARLAYAWLQSGQTDSALSVYERVVSTPVDDLDGDDVRWLPDIYKRLGELYEARNDTANAISYYSEFVELWKDADPELQPAVEDVRRRIARLVGDR